ncbi:hypothetical protein C0J52_16558 [Blattella germanica]|nr:hypothetical protein C0J52_16558 [Blattella germanica]
MSNYQRKTDRQLFTENQLTLARERIAAGSSVRAAANYLGAHEATLRKRLKAADLSLHFLKNKRRHWWHVSRFYKGMVRTVVARSTTHETSFESRQEIIDNHQVLGAMDEK